MNKQEQINYQRITRAISYIIRNFKQQPSLDEIAAAVHLSPFHFQKVFKDWAGTSPKKFLQYISISHAKKILKQNQATLFKTSLETGLSGTSRLHDLFVRLEGMTPAEYKNGGRSLTIHYSFSENRFGKIIIASTDRGICCLAFYEDQEDAKQTLFSKFPNAHFQKRSDSLQENALQIFQNDWTKPKQIKLHLQGTPFQLKVWESLLLIPFGELTTYGTLAQQIGQPNASRAVGTAIGNNPIAFLIPCHRVIQSSGIFGGYRWDPVRKTAMIGWENAQMETLQNGIQSTI